MGDLFSGISLYVLSFMAIGLALVSPVLIYAGLAFWAGRLARRWSRYAAFGVSALLLSPLILLPTIHWQRQRTAYGVKSKAIQQRIALTPKLLQVENPPGAILVHDYAFPELNFGKLGCFESLYSKEGAASFQWDSKRGWIQATLPDRFMEFDTDDKGRSDFGNRERTHRRGPYELWIVEGQQRRLVDVFFMAGDGLTAIPQIENVPKYLENGERNSALLAFLSQATGQCRKLNHIKSKVIS